MTDAERLRPLIDRTVLLTYLEGMDRFQTTDLVVFLDSEDPLPQVFLRTEWLASEVSLPVREKLQQPATPRDTQTQTAFWFVGRFPDGTMAAMTIISQRLQKGGDA